jgi:ATP-dependent Clp endopeptidase proteolytic subunit ClpP
LRVKFFPYKRKNQPFHKKRHRERKPMSLKSTLRNFFTIASTAAMMTASSAFSETSPANNPVLDLGMKPKASAGEGGSMAPIIASAENRTIMLNTELTMDNASVIIKQMRELNAIGHGLPICLELATPGGDADGCAAIINEIEALQAQNVCVITVAVSECASAGAFILAAGTIKIAEPGATIMAHDGQFGAVGKPADAIGQIKYIEKFTDAMYRKFARSIGHGQSEAEYQKVREWLRSDEWMSAEEAKEKGLVDTIGIFVMPNASELEAKIYQMGLAMYQKNVSVTDLNTVLLSKGQELPSSGTFIPPESKPATPAATPASSPTPGS